MKILIFALFAFNLIAAIPHHAEYFQQYVDYDISVELQIDQHRLDVEETLLYTNHSPDTLRSLFFHLYLNKYQARSLVNPQLTYDRGAIRIFEMKENDSLNVNWHVDETLMEVPLHNPLPPGYSVRFYFKFAAIIPPASGRYGYQGDHYDLGNWYITPVVYDRAGWHLHQHLDNEFYQEWGDYDVTIKVPHGFIVGATGELINPETALADTVDKYKDWHILYPEDTTRAVWRYRAENVHDFAWTTDPAYVWYQDEWNGITLNILAMDYNAGGWKEILEWGTDALRFMYENFGPYPYRQLTIADTYIRAGGIEYPQIVMINDFIAPDLQEDYFNAVVIHEMAHNWYYGLLGNNQTEKGWMDEGFTTFAEIKTMEALFGRYNNYGPGDRGWFINHFGYTNDDRLDNALQYLELARSGFDDDHINMHSDYMSRNGYTLEYSKTAMVLFMLEYVMGDSLFAQGLLNYYDQWHFKHPYPEDFMAVMEETAGYDLDWFFEQWLNTNRKLDYAVRDFDGEWVLVEGKRRFMARVYFERIEQIFMPIDFDVTLENGEVLKYRIPVDPYSGIVSGRRMLPYWHFSRKKYTAELNLPAAIERVEIDPSLRLMDVNYLNNYTGWLPGQEWYFMRLQSRAPPLNKYLWETWPQIGYNDIDKLKAGMRLNGSYLDSDHRIDLELWLKSNRPAADFKFRYHTPTGWLGNGSMFSISAFRLDGRQGAEIHLSRELQSQRFEQPVYRIEMGLANQRLFDEDYPAALWSAGEVNTVYFNWRRSNRGRGWRKTSVLEIDMQTSLFGSDFNFSQFSVEWQRNFYSRRTDWELQLRAFGAYSEGRPPLQMQYNLAGANGWSEFFYEFYRARGALPWPWKREGHLYLQGGGNVRGTALADARGQSTGNRILAFNGDVQIPNPLADLFIPILQDIRTGVFADAGMVWDVRFPGIDEFRKSAGISLTYDRFSYLDYIFNLKAIRLELPLWLDKVRSGSENFDFRWLVSLQFED